MHLTLIRIEGMLEMNSMKKISFVLISLLLCLTPLTVIIKAQQSLQITLYTDKTIYWLGDSVRVYGSLYFNSSLVSDGLVGLEMDNPIGYAVLFRTLSTGTLPSTQEVEILSLFPSDETGKPKNSFKRGYQAYFNITVRNNNDTAVGFYTTLTCFDSAQGIMDSSYWNFTLSPHTLARFVMPVYIPDQAPTGTATVYGNTFTKLLKLGGTPLSIEKSATFTITSSTGTSSQTDKISATQGTGNYSTTFKCPLYQYPGSYNVYTSSRYNNQTVTAQKSIGIYVPDLNNDMKVDVLDLILVAARLGWTGSPGGQIPEDVNRDGEVNVLDLIFVARFLGWEGP